MIITQEQIKKCRYFVMAIRDGYDAKGKIYTWEQMRQSLSDGGRSIPHNLEGHITTNDITETILMMCGLEIE